MCTWSEKGILMILCIIVVMDFALGNEMVGVSRCFRLGSMVMRRVTATGPNYPACAAATRGLTCLLCLVVFDVLLVCLSCWGVLCV